MVLRPQLHLRLYEHRRLAYARVLSRGMVLAHVLTCLPLRCLIWVALCSNWHLVVGSLKRCLWAGGVDVIDKVLATPEGLVSGNRTRLLRQYSRVISTAHCKVGASLA
jgi:hypothetical protein